MPIYEYRCLECDREFEVMQKFSEPPLAQCPSCSGQVRKLISRSAFHLKGDGWYVTDYARKSGNNGQSKTSDTTGSTTSESSTSDSTSTAATKESTKAASTTDTTTP
jgi:putative FmdB family regulatory protein